MLGGEQSGHVIALDRQTTGDGLITAVLLLDALGRHHEPLAEAATIVRRFPQVLDQRARRPHAARRLRRRSGRPSSRESAPLAATGSGRIVLRPSGTEPLVRVMVEHEDEQELAADRECASLRGGAGARHRLIAAVPGLFPASVAVGGERLRSNPNVRHHRLHRRADLQAVPDRRARAHGVPRLRLRRHLADRGRRGRGRARRRQPERAEAGRGHERLARHDRHRAHALGDARAPVRGQCASAARAATTASPSRSTASSRTTSCSSSACSPTVTRSAPRPMPRSSRTCSRRTTTAISSRPCA